MNVTLITILTALGVFGVWCYGEFEVKDKFNALFSKYILKPSTFKKLPPMKKTRIVSISLFILSVDMFLLSIVKGLGAIYSSNLLEVYRI